jgi:hypothetical protein
MALIATATGAALAGNIAERQPIAAVFMALVAIVFPMIIATRVAWAAGYEAGRTANAGKDANAERDQAAPSTESSGDTRIQRLM